MLFGALMLSIIGILWFLLVKGFLWKMILFFAGWVGIYFLLLRYVDGSNHIILTLGTYQMSWAALIPTVICFLCLLTTKDM
jgi:hypothetical protein